MKTSPKDFAEGFPRLGKCELETANQVEHNYFS